MAFLTGQIRRRGGVPVALGGDDLAADGMLQEVLQQAPGDGTHPFRAQGSFSGPHGDRQAWRTSLHWGERTPAAAGLEISGEWKPFSLYLGEYR